MGIRERSTAFAARSGLRRAALGVIGAGRNTMPAFRASYTDQELRDLAAYVAERLATGGD